MSRKTQKREVERSASERVTHAETRRDGLHRNTAGEPLLQTEGDEALLIGLHFPERKVGRPSVEDREAWIDAVAILMARGVTRPQQLSKLLDVPWVTAQGWITQVEQRHAMARQERNLEGIRGELFRQAKQVADVAWRDLMREPDPDVRNRLLNTVLNANKRMAAIYGVDTLKFEAASGKCGGEVPLTPEEVAHKYGVTMAEVAEIGTRIAQTMSRAATRKIEAQWLEAREEAKEAGNR